MLFGLLSAGSCSKYLDIVPDNVATIESAFSMRVTAERYLFTCYSWMPRPMSFNITLASGYWGGEFWALYPSNTPYAFRHARGEQGIVSPILNYWDGENGGSSMFRALRDCNIFLENIGTVPDIREVERNRWIAEAKFLKAYYHFYLLRLYGPIPLMKENMPISAGVEQVKGYRNPVDECFEYIVQLLDEAQPSLPLLILDRENELGRATSPMAASLKAKVLVTAASPLYNGNSDYAGLVDNRGVVLFNQTYDREKWKNAADACRAAIELCEEAGISLYRFESTGNNHLSDTTVYQLNIRNSVTEKWNVETIWGEPSGGIAQSEITPVSWNPVIFNTSITGKYGPSMEFTDIFYTRHGLPIDEDTSWDYEGRFGLKAAQTADRYNIQEGYTTAKMHFDRENRFYATFGFDGGVWYGQGRYDDNNPWVIQGKMGQSAGIRYADTYSPTGYWPKKLLHYQNILSESSYSTVWYAFPVLRLADLYLLYAESLNEYSGPGQEVYSFLNEVRTRAGLPTVQEAWTTYSSNPTKYTQQSGLREIIHQERQIELALEGQRFYDILRWKRADEFFNKPVSGWALSQSSASGYYQKTKLFEPRFEQRNYLEPIKESTLLNNTNLLQNPGW